MSFIVVARLAALGSAQAIPGRILQGESGDSLCFGPAKGACKHLAPRALLFLLFDSADILRVFKPLGLIFVVVCIGRRKEDIGGWLMFFYYQIYGSILLFILTAIGPAQSYLPSHWNEGWDYILFVRAVLFRDAAFLLVATVATVMLSHRKWSWVRNLRFALIAALGIMTVPLVLDAIFFQNALVWNFLRMIMLGAWLIYFYVSERVKRVFPEETLLQPLGLQPDGRYLP